MATTFLSTESALGAAALTMQGRLIEVTLTAAGKTRSCQFVGASEDGSQVTLRTFVGSQEKYANVATGRVQIAETLKQQCIVAYSRAQAKPNETAGERMGREAAESVDVKNARLWADRQQLQQIAQGMLNRGARRDVSGRFAGYSCETAGRI